MEQRNETPDLSKGQQKKVTLRYILKQIFCALVYLLIAFMLAKAFLSQ
jgi:hypothetical protein